MDDDDARREGALEALRALHQEVDREAAALAAQHSARLHCGRGCSACCLDGLSVLSVEAERIRRVHPELLSRGRAHPAGACAFLDEQGACRVYADRPYVCRTQGLPLRWFDESADGEIEEYRDICPENLEGPALTSLSDGALWLLGPYEEKLHRVQERFADSTERVQLRELFASDRERS
jgi:Fe-S-cluster containining protein